MKFLGAIKLGNAAAAPRAGVGLDRSEPLGVGSAFNFSFPAVGKAGGRQRSLVHPSRCGFIPCAPSPGTGCAALAVPE